MHVCVRRGALYLGTRQANLDDIRLWLFKSTDHAFRYPKQYRDTGDL